MKDADRILIVNLTDQSYHEAPLPEEVSYRYLGGRGLGAYLLAKYLPPGTDSDDEANPLIFVVGPLQGTKAPFSSKTVLCTKSPLRVSHHRTSAQAFLWTRGGRGSNGSQKVKGRCHLQ